MIRRYSSGFTMLETLLGTIAGILVLIGGMSILVGGHKSWTRSWENLQLQREASVAMYRMTQLIRGASQIQQDADGRGVRVTHLNGVTHFYWTDGTDDLQAQEDGGTPELLVEDLVEFVRFRQLDNLVTIDLRLMDGTVRTQLVSSISPRNTGG